MDDDLTVMPTSELIRLYIHYHNAITRQQDKGIFSLTMQRKEELCAAEINRRIPIPPAVYSGIVPNA